MRLSRSRASANIRSSSSRTVARTVRNRARWRSGSARGSCSRPAEMEERARFPGVAAKAGHYESFYVKACEPGGGRGIWIRHTVHKRPDAEPNASIWFVLFDRSAPAPRATKVTVPASELSTPPGSWIRIGDAEIGPGQAEGSVDTEALSAAWSLTFVGEAPPCRYLPADWLYEA